MIRLAIFALRFRVIRYIVLICLLVLAYGVATYKRGPLAPGEAQFDVANDLIGHNKGKLYYGNEARAEYMAQQFGSGLKTIRSTFISGTSKGFLTEGEFLSYCLKTPEAVVFMVHVPSFRKFTSEAKKFLGETAWTIAQKILKENGFAESTKLVVALRGIVLFDSILEGSGSGKPSRDSTQRESLFPYFIPPNQMAPAQGQVKVSGALSMP